MGNSVLRGLYGLGLQQTRQSILTMRREIHNNTLMEKVQCRRKYVEKIMICSGGHCPSEFLLFADKAKGHNGTRDRRANVGAHDDWNCTLKCNGS